MRKILTVLFSFFLITGMVRCEVTEQGLTDEQLLLLLQLLGLIDLPSLFGPDPRHPSHPRGASDFQCGGAASSSAISAMQEGRVDLIPEMVPDQLLVSFEETTSVSERRAALSAVAPAAARNRGLERRQSHHVIELEGESMAEATERLQRQPGVRNVQPNYIYRAAYLPNDAYFQSERDILWGLQNRGREVVSSQSSATVGNPGGFSFQSGGTAGFDVKAVQAWQLQQNIGSEPGSCKDVIVAVLDTAIKHDHPDLATNLWDGSNCVDDQGETITGGCNDGGWNYSHGADQDAHVLAGDNHGTHVAGTIGMQGNGGGDGVGVCWNVQLMLLQVLRYGGGSTSDIIRAMDFATQNGADIINMSLGGSGGEDGDLFYQSIERARDAGVLVVVAAGNSGHDNDRYPSFPANYNVSNIVSVAATDPSGEITSFSQYGRNCVEIGAPGIYTVSARSRIGGQHAYYSIAGTSMASPHVAGVAALMKQENQNCKAADLRDVLIRFADVNSNLEGKTWNTGAVADAEMGIRAIRARNCQSE